MADDNLDENAAKKEENQDARTPNPPPAPKDDGAINQNRVLTIHILISTLTVWIAALVLMPYLHRILRRTLDYWDKTLNRSSMWALMFAEHTGVRLFALGVITVLLILIEILVKNRRLAYILHMSLFILGSIFLLFLVITFLAPITGLHGF
ncbi:hypothetical protein ACFL4W_03165 [Planctomycetota bacterium]